MYYIIQSVDNNNKHTLGRNIIVYTSQSWHVCGEVYALSTYTKYKYAKHGSDARTTSAEVEETLSPLRRVCFYFFIPITFPYPPSGLLVPPPLMVMCFLALFKAEYLYLHITHILGRRTIIYRTTSSVRRVRHRHPCASLQHCRIENIITTHSPLIIIVVVVVRFSRIFSHFN